MISLISAGEDEAGQNNWFRLANKIYGRHVLFRLTLFKVLMIYG